MVSTQTIDSSKSQVHGYFGPSRYLLQQVLCLSATVVRRNGDSSKSFHPSCHHFGQAKRAAAFILWLCGSLARIFGRTGCCFKGVQNIPRRWPTFGAKGNILKEKFLPLLLLCTHSLISYHKLFCREAILWRRLSHQNVTPFLGVSTTLFEFCIVSDWMPSGDINTYLRRNPAANRLELVSRTASIHL